MSTRPNRHNSHILGCDRLRQVPNAYSLKCLDTFFPVSFKDLSQPVANEIMEIAERYISARQLWSKLQNR